MVSAIGSVCKELERSADVQPNLAHVSAARNEAPMPRGIVRGHADLDNLRSRILRAAGVLDVFV